jgi:hypothetical protein
MHGDVKAPEILSESTRKGGLSILDITQERQGMNLTNLTAKKEKP